MSKFETGEPMRCGVPTKQFVAGAEIEAGQAVSIDENGKVVPIPSPPKCECHERDGSYVCAYCYSQGYRGHMQQESPKS